MVKNANYGNKDEIFSITKKIEKINDLVIKFEKFIIKNNKNNTELSKTFLEEKDNLFEIDRIFKENIKFYKKVDKKIYIDNSNIDDYNFETNLENNQQKFYDSKLEEVHINQEEINQFVKENNEQKIKEDIIDLRNGSLKIGNELKKNMKKKLIKLMKM